MHDDSIERRAEAEARRRDEQRERNVVIGADAPEVTPPTAEFMTEGAMMSRCVFASHGSQVIVLPEDSQSGLRAAVLGLRDFVETYRASGELIDGGERWRSFVSTWRNSTARQTVSSHLMAIGRPRFLADMDGHTAVNLWTPRRRVAPHDPGLAAAFWRHLEFLVPDAADRARFVAWLAHIEQRPEQLPHHGYLMFTETFGVGRNWLASVLTRVWRGEVAPSVNLPALIDSGFNGTLAGRRLAIVDEVHVSESGRSRYAVENRLRQLLTEEVRTINPKYGREYREWNACRWLLLSNHMDAIPMPAADRRFAVIANPTARHPDGAAYYSALYAMLDDPDFIAAVAWDLSRHSLADFNPGAHPVMNAAKAAVIEATTPDLDKELAAVVAAWEAPIAAGGDLMRAAGVRTEDRTAVAHFGLAMRRAGHVALDARPAINGQRTRLWVLKGRAAPQAEALPEVVRAYRAAAWFRELVDEPF